MLSIWAEIEIVYSLTNPNLLNVLVTDKINIVIIEKEELKIKSSGLGIE